jgi:hypothetical protein
VNPWHGAPSGPAWQAAARHGVLPLLCMVSGWPHFGVAQPAAAVADTYPPVFAGLSSSFLVMSVSLLPPG